MIQQRMRGVQVCGVLAAMAGLPSLTMATGFRLPDQDAFATARGEAFAATADNASAIYYNPAGIANLEGHNVRLGGYGLMMSMEYESPSGGNFENGEELHAIPQIFYCYGMKDLPLAVGFGVYSPYGLSSDWGQDTGFRTVATEGELIYFTLNPVLAWRVLPTLSIAAGPTINYGRTTLEQGLTPVPGNDWFRFEGDGVDVGFTAGVLWRVHEMVSLGASYRSATEIDYHGETETVVLNAIPGVFPVPFAVQADARAAFQYPQNVVLGISFRPTPDWNLEFNADWTDWNQLNSLAIEQAAPPFLPGTVESVFNWESSWYYEVGLTRYLGESWALSVGYVFNENSVPDATYTPLVADLDRHFGSVGLGYAGRTLQFDLAYQYGYGPDREVVGSAVTASGQSADGTYSFQSHAILLTLGLRF